MRLCIQLCSYYQYAGPKNNDRSEKIYIHIHMYMYVYIKANKLMDIHQMSLCLWKVILNEEVSILEATTCQDKQ